MRIALATWGRFHFFHLARQLERHGALERIYSTYPRFKLKDEQLPSEKVFTYGLLETFLRAKERYGWRWPSLDCWIEHAKALGFDGFMQRHWEQPDILIGLSGTGAVSGPRAQAEGAKYICDRGSTHILHADDMLRAEYTRYGLPFRPNFAKYVERELREYDAADVITVPSRFVADTFVRYGIAREKLFINPYGASLGRFKKAADADPRHFTILSVGGARVRKGFGDLLEAFRRVKHPHKRLWVVGAVLPEVRPLLASHGGDDISFHGLVPNAELANLYSRADVLVLPSLEEGLALVQAEALACGCPVISTPNSGAEDLFEDAVQGFIVPPRDPTAIAGRLQQLADTPGLAATMGAAGQERVRGIGGWDSYGDRYVERCRQLLGKAA